MLKCYNGFDLYLWVSELYARTIFDYDIVIDIVHVLLVIMPETAASSSTRNRPSKYY